MDSPEDRLASMFPSTPTSETSGSAIMPSPEERLVNIFNDVSPQEYATRSQKAGLATGRSVEEQSKILRDRGFSQQAVQGLTQQYKLGQAEQNLGRFTGGKETILGSVGRQFIEHGIPFRSLVVNPQKDQQEAQQRFAEGKATDEDIKTLALAKRAAEDEQGLKQAGIAGEAIGALRSAPAIIGEFMAGGALAKGIGVGQAARVTLGGQLGSHAARMAVMLPAMPSQYLDTMRQKNVENGRPADSWEGMPSAMLHGYANLLVLGAVFRGAPGGVTGFGGAVKEAAKKGVTGALEQGIADSATNFADNFIPKAYKISTGYGTFEKLMSGDVSGAARKMGVDSLTFAAFAGMHAMTEGRSPAEAEKVSHDVAEAAAEDLTALKKTGLSEEGATRRMLSLQDRLRNAIVEADKYSLPRLNTPETPPARDVSPALVASVESRAAMGRAAADVQAGRVLVRPGEAVGERISAADALAGMKIPTLNKPSALAARMADALKRAEAFKAEEVKAEKKTQDLTETPPPAETPPPKSPTIAPVERPAETARIPVASEIVKPAKANEAVSATAPDSAPQARPISAERAITPRMARDTWASMDATDRAEMPKEVKDQLFAAMRKSGIDPNKIKYVGESRVQQPDSAALPREIADKVDASDLSDARKEGVKLLMSGGSLRAVKDAAGVSHETVRQDAIKLLGPDYASVVEEAGRAQASEFRDRQIEKMGGEEAIRKMAPSQRPTASENAAVEMLQGKIAANVPGEKVSFGAMGARTPEAAPETPLGEHLKESAKRWVNTVKDWVSRLAGATAPKTTRLSEASGDAIARVGAAKQVAMARTPQVLDRILPLDPENPSQSGGWARDVVGGVMVEMSLRHAREVHLADAKSARDAAATLRASAKLEKDKKKAAEMRAEANARLDAAKASEKSAKDVGTVIGSHRTAEDWEANPFKTEADFNELRNLPWVQEAIKRYQAEYVPLKEGYFRKAQGMDPMEEIDSKTQIPGLPIFRLHLAEGETRNNGGGGTSRGDITAQRARKLAQSKEAKLSGYYEIDLGKIIEGDLSRLVPNSAKAEMYRTMNAEKVGTWAEPGAEAPAEGWKRIPDVRPPKGTQENEKGQTDFWVHPDAYQETRQVLGVDQPASSLPFAGALAKATLASTVEAAYHTRNLISLLTRPGMNPLKFMQKVRDVVANDKETMQRIVELTELGAMKQHGFESATLEPGYKGGLLNPLNLIGKGMEFSSKVMTVVDRAMRLTADHAFDVLSKRPGVDGSEGARRDFINQLGNYNKLTQPKFIAWLRDTGIGPFATAGSNFFMQGLRSLTLSHGIKTTAREADLKMRGEMLLRMATLPALAAMLNYLAWGRFDGDDKTPIAGLKIGESNGKTSYLDLGGLVGVTRGMRETGLLALAEGQREGAANKGAKTGDSIDRAFHDIAMSALHPAIGPPVALVHTLMTGENTLGGHVAPRADLKKGESQATLNAYAALFSVNPVLEAWLKPVISEQVGLKEKKEPTASEKAFKMMGPFGVKARGEAPGAPHREMTIPVPTPQQRAAKK